MSRINKGLLKHVIFWLFFATALWGTFEQAYEAGADPIFSGTFGYPVPHHYIIGFAGIAVSYIMFTRNDWVMQNEIRAFKATCDLWEAAVKRLKENLTAASSVI